MADDDERAPILAASAAASPVPPFTAATSPPRPGGQPIPFDGVAPKALAPLSMPARRGALAAALVVLLLAGVGAWTLVGGGRTPTPVRVGVDTVSVPDGARKTGAGVLLW